MFLPTSHLQNLKLKESVLLHFFTQLSCLLNAQIPIITALDLLYKNQSEKFALLVIKLKEELLNGKSLFKTFSNYPAIFSPLICHIIAIGEQTGKIDYVLKIIVSYYESRQSFKRTLRQSLTYPIFTMGFALLIIVFMFVFIIPQFANIFSHITNTLPPITKFIFWVSGIIQQYFFLHLFLLIMIICLTIHYRSRLMSHLERLLFNISYSRKLLYSIINMRFCKHLSIALMAGIPIAIALKLLQSLNSHHSYQKALFNLIQNVSAGRSLNHSMASNFFDPLVIQMTKIGEQSGKLEIMLANTAALLESQIIQHLQTIITLIEPLIMLMLGVLIGGLVSAIYLPLFKLGLAL